ncbi:MAG: hypothetical protein K2P55_12330 [Bacteroides acidifaciens]|uniref:hypothetical protein n=1 Tax=Bacteroides acidifaciens TaxID=85831 RepID=UPI0023D70F85|nr:hypothetical protein [Bacteroides acidifaciens]MDE6822342.1 hypothetical protein [Bacteroides acidifaciens]MDE6987673.1 hypothetical protein [Bacteroides acidifaciens]
MNAITLVWKQILKGLKQFQTNENKEDATEKAEKARTKPAECCGDIRIDSLTDTEQSVEKEKKEKEKEKKVGTPINIKEKGIGFTNQNSENDTFLL